MIEGNSFEKHFGIKTSGVKGNAIFSYFRSTLAYLYLLFRTSFI